MPKDLVDFDSQRKVALSGQYRALIAKLPLREKLLVWLFGGGWGCVRGVQGSGFGGTQDSHLDLDRPGVMQVVKD